MKGKIQKKLKGFRTEWEKATQVYSKFTKERKTKWGRGNIWRNNDSELFTISVLIIHWFKHLSSSYPWINEEQSILKYIMVKFQNNKNNVKNSKKINIQMKDNSVEWWFLSTVVETNHWNNIFSKYWERSQPRIIYLL